MGSQTKFKLPRHLTEEDKERNTLTPTLYNPNEKKNFFSAKSPQNAFLKSLKRFRKKKFFFLKVISISFGGYAEG